MFGFTLLRIIHQIVNLRKHFPQKIIWIRKEDFKSAYRRVHVTAETAVRTAVRVRVNRIDMILISLRLVFGGASCPSEFCVISDIVTDTINDLLLCKNWDHKKIKSKFVDIIPKAKRLDEKIEFAQAKDITVNIPLEIHGKADSFIDDIITVAVDIGDNRARIEAAPCTVLHAIAHNANNNSKVPRNDIISDDKNEAEGEANEIKLVLGWSLDTRRLLVKLPYHKKVAWTN